MPTSLTILAYLFLGSLAFGFPTPIPKPKQTPREAAELVMKSFAIHAKEYPPRWRDEAFPQLITFTTFKYSEKLQEWIPEEDAEKRLKESNQSWLLNEWGWVVTVVMAHDLSQTETFFVRESGEVVLLFETM